MNLEQECLYSLSNMRSLEMEVSEMANDVVIFSSQENAKVKSLILSQQKYEISKISRIASYPHSEE